MPQHLLYPDEDDDYVNDTSEQEIELPMSGIPRQVFQNPEVESDGADSAPEDVTFTTSKNTALESIKSEKSSAKKIRDEVKEKRKKRQEFFLAQHEKKKSRLKELEKRKLPDDFIESIPVKNVPDEAETGVDPSSKKRKNEKEKPSTNVGKNNKSTSKQTKKEKNPLPTNVVESSEDFVPLNSKLTEFRVKVVEDGIGNVVGNAKDLISFKNKLMTGPMHRREPTKKALARKAKQSVAGIGMRRPLKYNEYLI